LCSESWGMGPRSSEEHPWYTRKYPRLTTTRYAINQTKRKRDNQNNYHISIEELKHCQ
jgi:hypothetical protein